MSQTPSDVVKRGLVDRVGFAALCGLSVAMINKLRGRGELPPAVVFGTAVRWRVEDVEKFIADRMESK